MKSFSAFLLAMTMAAGHAYAQLIDDFSDGEFASNPTWVGTADHFFVNETSELQLRGPAAGTSWLVTRFEIPVDADVLWRFRIKQNFAPSGANYGRVYLMSDQQDLTGSLNGYFLQFGEAGSNDAITLSRQTGTSVTPVCRGVDGFISSAFDLVVQVIRTHDGYWELHAGETADALVMQASGIDATHTPSSWFGFRCTYTITNASRSYFDDFMVQATAIPDTTPPQIVVAHPLSPTLLQVEFSEPLDPASAVTTKHYTLLPAVHPVDAELSADGQSVVLQFDAPFPNGHISTLEVREMADVEGNIAALLTADFFFFQPYPISPGDVIINEIMADPSPPVGLPEYEYVEVLNRSTYPVSLEGWKFSDAGVAVTLPFTLIHPGEYRVLCSPAAAKLFEHAIGIPGFPSLNNTGDNLKLISASGEIVDSVNYVAAWYRDAEKADGGWALERIDPDNRCETVTNWVASGSPSGGTPGFQNAVFARRPDNRPPELLAVLPYGDRQILLSFNEALDRNIPPADLFVISPQIEISSIEFADDSKTGLILHLESPLTPGVVYTIVAGNIRDCPGNRMPTSQPFVFLLPERAGPGDIVINEVLFNPAPGGADFVELYNTSEKVVDLKGWTLRNALATAPQPVVISDDYLLLHPGQYKVLTESPEAIMNTYVSTRQETLVRCKLPSMTDHEGFLALLDENALVIDSIRYHADMHSPFLRSPEGVSLERIGPRLPGYDPTNWRSAPADVGFATPGYPNASMREGGASGADAVIVEPELLQIGIPGQDFARIQYRFDQGGFVGTVRIYDPQGRAVRELAENQLLGTEGFFRWDADYDSGGRAGTGYYFVWFSVFNAEGQRKVFRKRIAIF